MRRRVCSLAVSLVASIASGATLERLSLEEMAAKSSSIVRARALSDGAVLVGSTIYTQTRFQVLERWKGPEGAEVDVSQPGGRVGQISQSYSGVPRFQAGQELVLFLWTGPSGRTQVIGLSQGVFEVERSANGEVEVVRQPVREVLLEPGSGAPMVDEGIRTPLARLVSSIRGALERTRQK